MFHVEQSGRVDGRMVLFGTLVNVLCIIVGSIFGLFLTNIQEKYKETVMQGIALVVILIGLQMAFQTESIIIVLISMLTGGFIGEFLKLEAGLNKLGYFIGSKFRSKQGEDNNIAQAFVTASLIFAVGAMAILGALDSGIRGDHEVLMTKGMLDGFTAFVLTTSLGIGVVFSSIPVLLWQGTIALLATQIDRIIPEALFQTFITELAAVGGLLIVAIGLNILKVTNIRVTNLLPAIVTVGIVIWVQQLF